MTFQVVAYSEEGQELSRHILMVAPEVSQEHTRRATFELVMSLRSIITKHAPQEALENVGIRFPKVAE